MATAPKPSPPPSKGVSDAIVHVAYSQRERLLSSIRRRMASQLLRRHPPEDVLQDVVLRALQSAHRSSSPPSLDILPWLHVIARHEVLHLARRTRAAPEGTGEGGEPPETLTGEPWLPSSPWLAVDPAAWHDAWPLLRPIDRACLVLRDAIGLPWRHVGLCIGRSPEAARKLHGRTVQRLLQTYRDKNPGDSSCFEHPNPYTDGRAPTGAANRAQNALENHHRKEK